MTPCIASRTNPACLSSQIADRTMIQGLAHLKIHVRQELLDPQLPGAVNAGSDRTIP